MTDSTSAGVLPPAILKTSKMFLNGQFVRSESGRTTKMLLDDGSVLEAADASRKDVRDAVRHAASAKWAANSPYLKGQILYRLAEMTSARAAELDAVAARLGLAPTAEAAVDLLVAYAGWPDKLGLVLGSSLDVPGHATSTSVQPLGVCGVWLSSTSTLADVVAAAASALAAGNTALILADGACGALAQLWAEAVAVSDVPPGALQMACATRQEAVTTLAGATSVRALDVVGHPERVELERSAAQSLVRCRTSRPFIDLNDAFSTLAAIRWQLGYKTAWCPTGR